MKRVLILGGTGDAGELAAKASQIPGLEVISSLAGRTQNPIAPMGLVRVGGFGGETGLAEFLHDCQIDYLIDATHPFAAQISWNAAAAAAKADIPHLMLIRPVWQKTAADHWIEVPDIEAAVSVLERQAKRVFLTIGRQQLAPFARLQNLWFLMRSIDPPAPDTAVPKGLLLFDRGPFTLAQERKLLTDYAIDTIVSKNSGGDATYAKILAAREMQLAVVLISRPAMPAGEHASDAQTAFQWLQRQLNNSS